MVRRAVAATGGGYVATVHPLLPVLEAAAAGRFPPADGRTDVLPPDADGTVAVVAFTGHAYVLADVDAAEVAARQDDDAGGGFGGALAPRLLTWLAGANRAIGSIDAVLVAPGRGDPAPRITALAPEDPGRSHPRVRRAAAHRRDLQVVGDDTGVVIVGTGLAGRTELSVELLDSGTAPSGRGRQLIAAGLGHVPAGVWCFAQVAPGNARSLRSFLAAGFVPIGSEVLITG